MSNNQSQTVVVLGMHRSGTSMIGGVLDKLGVNMGEELLGKGISNPLGHFEDKEFLNLNIEILKSAGGSWDSPPARKKILRQKDKFQKKIKDLINNRTGIWGWKDPRTNLTIELYSPYLSNPYFIVCYRALVAVAKSLKRRSWKQRGEMRSRRKRQKSKRMTIRKGITLKRIYEKRIDNFFHSLPKLQRLNLHYEKVTSAPEKWVKEIIDFLDLQVSNKQEQEAIDFILPNKEIQNLKKKNNNS